MKTKNYFLNVILISMTLQLAACKEDSTEPQAVVPVLNSVKQNDKPEESEGGISAGGGGTLPANPIYEYQIWKVLETAKTQLRMYINYRRFYSDMMDKYFDGSLNIANVLENTDIEVREKAPCKDKFGKEVDASIFSSKPNTICLSIQRIQPKLIKEIANKEILALLVHELTHLVGATEIEAVEAQKEAAFYFSNLTEKDTENLESTLWGISMEYPNFPSIKDSLEKDISQNNLEGLQDSLSQMLTVFSDSTYFAQSSMLHDLPLSFVDYRLKDYLSYLEFKIYLVRGFLDKIQGKPSPIISPEQCFVGKDIMTFGELKKNCFSFADATAYDSLPITKIQDIREIPTFLNDVILGGDDLSGIVRAIAFNQPLPHFNFPGDLEKENPFTKYVGSYTTQLIGCSSTWNNNANSYLDLKQVVIRNGSVSYPVDINNVVYIKTVQGYGASDQPIYNGGGSDAMLVSGDAKSARFTEERGTRWVDRQGHGWSKKLFEIQDSNGKLILNLQTDGFRLDSAKQWEAVQTCQYELIKQ